MASPEKWKIIIVACIVVTTTATFAQTFTFLAGFDGSNGDWPTAAPVQGLDGNFYGTTYTGGNGAYFGGTVFGFSPAARMKSLYSFPCSQSSCPNGSAPTGNLLLAANGDFYGTAVAGGTGSCSSPGCGTIFKVSREGVLTTLYNFNGTDGQNPIGPLVQGSDGSLYGVTNTGGIINSDCYGCGTVFKLTPDGVLTTIYQFCSKPGCADGSLPFGGLKQSSDGNFYGYTTSGGAYLGGTIFEITPDGLLTTLYSFCYYCPNGGVDPSGVVQASDGNFYGVTAAGGPRSLSCQEGCGTFFRLTPSGKLRTLLSFNGTDGEEPGGLTEATDGNFYGTTYFGGSTYFYGTIFKVTPTGNLTTLYAFCAVKDCLDGFQPNDLVQATDGSLYGTAAYGGQQNIDCTTGAGRGCGTVFSLDVGLSPFVAFVRNSGAVGQAVRILGQGLTGTTSVLFNGTPATFTVNADTFLTATVPAGAKSGYVTVTTPTGTLTSNVQFRILP